MSSDLGVVERPETVELETVYTEVQTSEAKEDSALDNFEYTNYLVYFPVDAEKREFLINMFETRQHGWRTRAELLIRCAEINAMLTDQVTKVDDYAQNKLLGKHGPRVVDPSKGLRTWLNSRDEETLQKLCVKHSVSYSSFSNDRPNLIEALIDEMERGE